MVLVYRKEVKLGKMKQGVTEQIKLLKNMIRTEHEDR